MRLLKPSPGEVYDRLTILALKIRHSTQASFIEEHAALCKYLKENNFNVPVDLATELGRINTRLWDLEDEQRQLIKSSNFENVVKDSDEYQFVQNAVTIVRLNDARADTVRKINEACGINQVE